MMSWKGEKPEHGRILMKKNRDDGGVKEGSYPVTADHSRTLAEMIAAGHFDGVDKIGFIVQFGEPMTAKEVLAEFDRLGLRAVTFAEWSALIERYPEVQRLFPPDQNRDDGHVCESADEPMTTKDVLAEPDRRGLRPATTSDLGMELDQDGDDPNDEWDASYYRFATVKK